MAATSDDRSAVTEPDAVVRLEVVDRVAHLVLDRAATRNALDLGAFEALVEHAAVLAAADPSEVGAVVVSGRGGTFSSGLDVALFGSIVGPGVDVGRIALLQRAFDAVEDLDVPVIAAIEGHCLGGGLQLALACHLRAVAPSASLALLETTWGIVPDLGATWRLPRLVGTGRATEIVLSARRVGADEALASGLAELALPAEGALEAAHDIAVRLAEGPAALRRVPRLVRENTTRGRADALAAEAEVQVELLAGHDALEAMRARVEGRPPRFTGR
jgi:enoyl-CoA hydratase/carnithine racemase